MLIVTVSLVLSASPLQWSKAWSGEAVAVSVTSTPTGYIGPSGIDVTVPASKGTTDSSSEYFVGTGSVGLTAGAAVTTGLVLGVTGVGVGGSCPIWIGEQSTLLLPSGSSDSLMSSCGSMRAHTK